MSSGKPIRVAVASDQPIFRRGLTSLIMDLNGVKLVGEAVDEADAVQICELLEPDLLFLDMKAPLESGRDLARSIHQRWPKIKVILLVSVHREVKEHDSLDPGFTCYFSKDVSEDEFAAAIQRIGQDDRSAPREPAATSSFESSREQDRNVPRVEAIHQTRRLAGQPDQEILTRELVMAGKIQADILPEKAPVLPGWELSARLESARETSGDFYDFIPLVNHNWGIVVGDVTDKGMGAALFMALSSTLFRSFAVRYPTLPSLTMDVVNERILTDTRGGMFVTAFFGVLEPHTGRFRFVNAGHPPACLVSTKKGKLVDWLRPTGMALGLMEKAHWGQKIIRLWPGDTLVLYTDGITEAQNADGKFFGEQRLLEVIRTKSGCPAREIQDAVLAEVQRFVGEAHAQDDIALIVICRKE